MTSADKVRKQFVFVMVNQDDDRTPTGLTMIRAHAMRESLRQKRTGTTNRGLLGVQPAPYQTGRFRLAADKTKPNPKPRVRESKYIDINSEKDSTTSNSSSDNRSFPGWQNEEPDYTLSPTPSRGRLDPFDIMPIRIGSREQSLIYYYDAAFIQNSVAFDRDHRMLSVASSDPAWLNATFAVVAMNYHLRDGTSDFISSDTLYHVGEAVKIVKSRLNEAPPNTSDGTLGAIASLANHEMMTGSILGAATHLKGLEQLLKIRGQDGISQILSSFLRQLIAFSDMAFSGLALTKPRFSPLQLSSPSSISIEMLVPGVSEEQSSARLSGILLDLHLLSTMKEAEYRELDPESRSYFSATISKDQYDLGTLGEGSFRDADSAKFVYRSKCLATSLYINLVLRDIAPNAELHHLMVCKLKESLEMLGADPCLKWGDDLNLLLWVLCIGGAAVNNWPERSYFVFNLALVSITMGISSYLEFREILKEICWVEKFCGRHCVALWEEMEEWKLVSKGLARWDRI